MEDGMATEMGDIGISISDAQAIKQAILQALREGNIEVGDVGMAVHDLIGAFKDVDNEVFARDSMTKELTARRKVG